MVRRLTIEFPLPRVHTGIHLGNGRLGVLVWGTDRLVLTFGLNGFWYRSSTRDKASKLPFTELSSLLLEGREQEVRKAFEETSPPSQQLNGGRYEIEFPSKPRSGEINLETGVLEIRFEDDTTVVIFVDVKTNMFVVRWFDAKPPVSIMLRPAQEWSAQRYAAIGASIPVVEADTFGGGFIQSIPEQDSLTVAWRTDASFLIADCRLSGHSIQSIRAALEFEEIDQIQERVERDWSEYSRTVPDIHYPDDLVQQTFLYGVFKLHALLHPSGTAATLQGGWMEEHRLPLWSNDYHFNINLQQMYTAASDLKLWSHLQPLWDMVAKWSPRMQSFGEHFFGVSGAWMLPHAVDDLCNPIGCYWQGTVDHVSTVWTALLALHVAEESGSTELMLDLAIPMAKGAFEGVWAMLEERVDGTLYLPVSVSPEYGEGGLGMWGGNASFSLAAYRALSFRLISLSQCGLVVADSRWGALLDRLPECATAVVPLGPYDSVDREPQDRIAIWIGQDLEFSHRHHSHLAGLYPFGLWSDDSDERVSNALLHWSSIGGGGWCAWSMMWAVQIMARAGWHDAAEHVLRFAIASLRNEGGNLSAGGPKGIHHGWGSAAEARKFIHDGDHEVMQHDANLAVISAVLEVIRAKQFAGCVGWENAARMDLRHLGLGIKASKRQSSDSEDAAGELVSM